MKGTLDDFTDSSERQAFIDTLCDLRRSTSKNIWLIRSGEYTTYSMERGVKHLIIGNELVNNDDPMDVAENTKYMVISINRDELSYEVRRVFEK